MVAAPAAAAAAPAAVPDAAPAVVVFEEENPLLAMADYAIDHYLDLVNVLSIDLDHCSLHSY